MAKNIFENFDYDDYYLLLDKALEDDVHIVHDNNGYGGFTFCWARETAYAKSKMIRISVSFCSPKDQFCRKIGAYNALSNWYNKNETIVLPVGSEDSANIVNNIRYVLGAAYWSNH